jgi:hypothetical protein
MQLSNEHDGSIISTVLKKVRNERESCQSVVVYDCTFPSSQHVFYILFSWKLGGMRRKLYYPSESTIELTNSYKCKLKRTWCLRLANCEYDSAKNIPLRVFFEFSSQSFLELISCHGICLAPGYNNAGWCEKSSSSSSSSSDSNGDDDDDDDDHRRK